MEVLKLKTKISAEQYLEGELVSPVKHEFVSGEVFAMAGASDRHHRISVNLFKELDALVADSNCDAYVFDMKLRTSEDDFYYPDVFVACDESPASEYYREQPLIVIEVTSPSTRQIDRREKLKAYQAMPSVKEYVVIDQDKFYIELHRRQPDGRWITYFYNRNDRKTTIEFQSVELKTNLDTIYRRVQFPPEPPLPPEPDLVG